MSTPKSRPVPAIAPRTLERLGVLVLLIAACVPRLRDVGGTFDRQLEGFQGACFAAFAVNYERLGAGALGGYPTYFLDVPEGFDPALYVYANHPPLVPLLCWGTLKAIGPDGWEDAWTRGEPPRGIELALRLPFLIAHVLGLWAFWWALRQSGGARRALIGLALLATTPISILYAYLVNYENPSLLFVFLACGFQARALRGGGRRPLIAAALCFAAACAITFGPAFFAPPLVLLALRRDGARRAAVVAAALGAACALPLAAHALWVRAALPAAASDTVLDRARLLAGPLFTGELPLGEWIARQAGRVAYLGPWPLGLAALGGLALALARGARRAGSEPADRPVDLGPALLAGGVLYLLAFYRHTFDGEGPLEGQTIFAINLAPGLAACAATLLDALARPLARLRGGIAPLVVATSLIALPGIARANEVRRLWREPGPNDEPARGDGPAQPLPATDGRRIGALVPPGAICYYPLALGFTPATGFYAWRSLVAVDRASFGMLVGRVAMLGLGDRPAFLLLPRDPSPAVLAQIGDVRAELAAEGAPFARDDRFEVWALE